MTSNKGVSWKWNPPAAPRFGGVFESMIKSAKQAIFAVLGDAEVNDEELETIFIGVESLLNWRPLTAVSDDPSDECVLTPNHFLIKQIGGDFVPQSVNTKPFNPRKYWRRLQELTRHVEPMEYHRLDEDRNGTSVTTICSLEMLSLLLIQVQ